MSYYISDTMSIYSDPFVPLDRCEEAGDPRVGYERILR